MNSRRLVRPSWISIGVALLLVLLAAMVLMRPAEDGFLQLSNPRQARVVEVRQLFDTLPDDRPLVLVAMDPDLGTYPEIRPATRAAFDDLLRRGARLAFVSYSPEGRAIAVAEQRRLLDSGALAGSVLDLGFVSGSEAGLVSTVTKILPSAAEGPMADAIRERGGGMTAFSLALVVGGTEIGARSWVEQVGSRVPELPVMAIAPTFLWPELQPYLRSGQLVGLLATARDDAAFVAAVIRADPRVGPSALEQPPAAAAMMLGMLLALTVLGVSLLRRPKDADLAVTER
jgi:hypothetical protein